MLKDLLHFYSFFGPLVLNILKAFLSMSLNSIGIWCMDGWITNERSLAWV